MESNKNRTFDLYKMLVDQQVILAYEGMFDQEVIKSFLGMTEKKLAGDGIDEATRKKLFNVLMEALQNISKHQKTNNTADENAIFILASTDLKYYVVTGNYMETDKIPIIKNKLDLVNSLDKEGLKEIYKKARLNSVISDVGGAGLGFIDMARKSGNKLQYQFTAKENNSSFFVLMATISNN
jgi:hypothetical protein